MRAWKSINLSKKYGDQRIFLIIMLTMILSFIIIYTCLSLLALSEELAGHHVFQFVIALILLYPIHKLLHLIPLAGCLQPARIRFSCKWRIFPLLQIRICEPISKRLYMTSLFMPLIIVSLVLCVCITALPQYSHYLSILFSFHLGLCVTDIISLKNMFGSPSSSYIEEHDDGYNILVITEWELSARE